MVLTKAKELITAHFPNGTQLEEGWNQLSVLPFGENYAQIQWVFRRLESVRLGSVLKAVNCAIAVQLKAAESEEFFFKQYVAAASDEFVIIRTPSPKWLAEVGIWLATPEFKLESVQGITLGVSEDFELKTSLEIAVAQLNIYSETSVEEDSLVLTGDFHLIPKLKIASGDYYVEQIFAYSNTEIESPKPPSLASGAFGEAPREKTVFRGEINLLRSADSFSQFGTIFRSKAGSVKYRVIAKVEKARLESTGFARLRVNAEGGLSEQSCL